MTGAALNTIDTLDMVGLEMGLEMALEELLEAFADDAEMAPLIRAASKAVEKVTNRVVAGPQDVVQNVRDLALAREALKKLGLPADEALRQIEVYLKKWLEARAS